MIDEAIRAAARQNLTSAQWLRLRAEELPAGLGTFRYATFALSFHWMDRELVAARFSTCWSRRRFRPCWRAGDRDAFPRSAAAASAAASGVKSGVLSSHTSGSRSGPARESCCTATPGNEWEVLQAAGFETPVMTRVAGWQLLERTVDDVVAHVFSLSGSAPHLFGDQLADFEHDLRLA